MASFLIDVAADDLIGPLQCGYEYDSLAGNLTAQVRNIAEVTRAVARGDLSRKITVDVKGEILELKNTITRWSIS